MNRANSMSHSAVSLLKTTLLAVLAVYMSAFEGIVGVGFSAGAADAIYSVEGRVHYEAKIAKVAMDTDFTVCVSNRLWSITTIPQNRQGIFKQVYDGDVVSSAGRFLGDVSKLSMAGNDSTLGIHKSDMPDCMTPGVGQIWLAYCSSGKLSERTNGPLEPVWFIDKLYSTAHFTAPASWKLTETLPFLPVRVDYFRDSGSFDILPPLVPRPSPNQFEGGTKVWASYRAGPFTKTGSLLLPEEFAFEVFTQGQKLPLYAYHGRLLKAYESIPIGAFDHGFGTKTLVQDNRFVSLSNPAAVVQYVTTNKSIPKTNDPWMITAATRAKIAHFIDHGERRSERPRNRGIPFLVVSALALLPIVLMLVRRKHRKTNRA